MLIILQAIGTLTASIGPIQLLWCVSIRLLWTYNTTVYVPSTCCDLLWQVKEINALGMEVMVTVWPFSHNGSLSYDRLLSSGWLTATVNSTQPEPPICPANNRCPEGTVTLPDALHGGLVDVTNTAAMDYVWSSAHRLFSFSHTRVHTRTHTHIHTLCLSLFLSVSLYLPLSFSICLYLSRSLSLFVSLLSYVGIRCVSWRRAVLHDGYYKHGIRSFWLDASEPEYYEIPQWGKVNWPNAKWKQGSLAEIGQIFATKWVEAIHHGLRSQGENATVMLPRGGYAGSWRYGAGLWSGDIWCDFETLATQVRTGVSAQISGFGLWTTDVSLWARCSHNSPQSN